MPENLPAQPAPDASRIRPRFDPQHYSPIFDLFKYPVFVFSVLFALLLAQGRGMRVSKLGTDGIELEQLRVVVDSSQHSSNGNYLQMYDRIQKLEASVEALKQAAAPREQVRIKENEDLQTERTNTVPNDLTALAASAAAKPTAAGGLEGWVYLGKVQNNQWRPFHLRTLTWAPPGRLLPSKLDVGSDYLVSNVNLIVRPSAPDNGNSTATKNLGVLLSRTRVTLVAAPKGYPEGAVTRYWGLVRVVVKQ